MNLSDFLLRVATNPIHNRWGITVVVELLDIGLLLLRCDHLKSLPLCHRCYTTGNKKRCSNDACSLGKSFIHMLLSSLVDVNKLALA
ncbi:hypothetical protein CDES_08290 [Corynebacterium deserti GIMN1.010]|uniref:Uncharacterized protein n=1 Tax=Corynebacterium deserti GIMN1.010 TaxID=931089 RepID=A0A0M3Q9R7_9CORY|nr:hypothetical protein CDES_08290 [Corynebacterium deserti GIMN1.010]